MNKSYCDAWFDACKNDFFSEKRFPEVKGKKEVNKFGVWVGLISVLAFLLCVFSPFLVHREHNDTLSAGALMMWKMAERYDKSKDLYTPSLITNAVPVIYVPTNSYEQPLLCSSKNSAEVLVISSINLNAYEMVVILGRIHHLSYLSQPQREKSPRRPVSRSSFWPIPMMGS